MGDLRIVDLDDGSSTVPMDARQRYVVTDWMGNRLAGPCSHADAWRFVDRRTGDPISPAEKRAQYGWDMSTER